jgi:hypothetical protein
MHVFAPVLAMTLKIAALATALTCVGPVVATGDGNPARLHCRMYFGCAPVDRLVEKTGR